MIHALGYSQDPFHPHDPGRLCRGRERWIEPFEVDEGERGEALHRLVITGAAFSDDSAADALRGLPHSGLDLVQLITTLFPRKPMLAFMEDGHPADIPEAAEGVEAYEGYRAGGMVNLGLVRWHQMVHGARELKEILGDPPDDERLRGLLVLDAEPSPEEVEELLERLFLLVGMSTLDSPPARYQPAALPEVLDKARAVILLHRDKHGVAVGIYSREPVKIDGRLEPLADKEGALLVPFAIPPMLARWDRAIAELRGQWMATRSDEFPVPPAPEPEPWMRGRGRGQGREAPIAEQPVEAVEE